MATFDATKNFAKAIVSTGYAAGATSIVLASGDGAKLPEPSTDGEFNLIWWDASSYGDPADDPNKEIVRCTARSTDTLTVTRAQEGTTDSIKNISGKTYLMALAMTAKVIDDITGSISDSVTDYVANTAGRLDCGTPGALALFQAITDGAFKVSIDGTVIEIGSTDLSGATSYADVATLIQAAVRTATGALETFTYETDHFRLTSATDGLTSIVDYLIAPTAGTDLSVTTLLNGVTGGTAVKTVGTSQEGKLVTLNSEGMIDDGLAGATFVDDVTVFTGNITNAFQELDLSAYTGGGQGIVLLNLTLTGNPNYDYFSAIFNHNNTDNTQVIPSGSLGFGASNIVGLYGRGTDVSGKVMLKTSADGKVYFRGYATVAITIKIESVI